MHYELQCVSGNNFKGDQKITRSNQPALPVVPEFQKLQVLEVIDILYFCDLVGDEEQLLEVGQVLEAVNGAKSIERDVQHFQVDEAVQVFDLGYLKRSVHLSA